MALLQWVRGLVMKIIGAYDIAYKSREVWVHKYG